MWIGIDIGGAHLKFADGAGRARSIYFPLWQNPEGLATALRDELRHWPADHGLAVTMTGELADCFVDKAEGVAAIVAATVGAAEGRPAWFYGVDGHWRDARQATQAPLAVAAANWRGTAQFSLRYIEAWPALLIDIGSTTTDAIPLGDGRVVAIGANDPERLLSGELVYTGVQRSPVCAVVSSLPWRGRPCPVAQELFATTWDAYLTLGELPPAPESRHTADGRPATVAAARDRLARQICADRTLFSDEDAHAAALAIVQAQTAKVAIGVRQVLGRCGAPSTVVLAGQGRCLGQRLLERLSFTGTVVLLDEVLGPDASRAAAAHALAVLAREELP